MRTIRTYLEGRQRGGTGMQVSGRRGAKQKARAWAKEGSPEMRGVVWCGCTVMRHACANAPPPPPPPPQLLPPPWASLEGCGAIRQLHAAGVLHKQQHDLAGRSVDKAGQRGKTCAVSRLTRPNCNPRWRALRYSPPSWQPRITSRLCFLCPTPRLPSQLMSPPLPTCMTHTAGAPIKTCQKQYGQWPSVSFSAQQPFPSLFVSLRSLHTPPA